MAQSIPIVLHESEPATEWLFGAPVQKVSPTWAHAVLQRSLTLFLHAWAGGRGTVGPEWRFWLTPAGEEPRYLVPDVAFVSYDRFRPGVTLEIGDESRFAPDVAVEILSPDDRMQHVEHKIDVYLRAGTLLVMVVDPEQRLIRAVDEGTTRTFTTDERFEHAALPGFTFDIATFFEELGPQ